MLSRLLPAAAALFAATTAQAFTYPDFANTQDLQLNGSALVTGGAILQLTPNQPNRAGSAFTKFGVETRGFSTAFTFRIRKPGGSPGDCTGQTGGEGLTFVLQRRSPLALGQNGAGMGYAGIGSPVGQEGSSIAIEFDTACESNKNDPSTNHVGLVAGGKNVHTSLPTADVATRFDNGRLWSAWVDYDGTMLEIRVSPTTARPPTPILAWPIDIPATIGGDCGCAGFTSGTGLRVGRHEVLHWRFDGASFPAFAIAMPPIEHEGPPPTCTQLKK